MRGSSRSSKSITLVDGSNISVTITGNALKQNKISSPIYSNKY